MEEFVHCFDKASDQDGFITRTWIEGLVRMLSSFQLEIISGFFLCSSTSNLLFLENTKLQVLIKIRVKENSEV